MIKAIIFDMNGVIIDDEHIHEIAFIETVKPYGIELTHKDYIDCCAGKTDKAGYEEISTRFNIDLPVSKLLDEKSSKYLELFPTHKKDYPGVVDLIHSLSKTYLVALTSSSTRVEVELISKEFGIDKDFKVTISANDITKGKPDPEPYIVTAQKLGVQPNECIVIEDSRSGVISAKNAGCYCIGVTTTHTNEELGEADLIVDSLIYMDMNQIIGAQRISNLTE